MNIKSSQTLVEEAQKSIETLSVTQFKELAEKHQITLIDVRDIRELWKEGTIENSKHIPRGMLEFWIDPESPYHKEIFSQKKKFVFYCASGWRSALSTKTAIEMGLEEACHIEGGFSAWVKSNGEVETVE